jgi:hypothetical protein
MNAPTLALEGQQMNRSSSVDSEWIWLVRVLLLVVFGTTAAMRLTLAPAELARLGDWTLGLLPSAAVGTLQMGAALTLLLPRRRPWLEATLGGLFLLSVYLLGSLLAHLTAGGHGWTVDVLRLSGIGLVVRDQWRILMLGARQEA